MAKQLFLAVNDMDKTIQTVEPFKLIKINEEQGKLEVKVLVERLYVTALNLSYFLPRTSAKIIECIRENKMPEKPLFARLP
jgi:methionyl-tRNA synthetase